MSERAHISGGNQERVETTALGDVPETGQTSFNGVGTDLILNNIQAVAEAVSAAPVNSATTAVPLTGSMAWSRTTSDAAALAGDPVTLRNSSTPRWLRLDWVAMGGAAVRAPAGTRTANSAVGLYTYAYYPGLPNTATALGGLTLAQNGILPRVWTASMTPTTGDSWAYSLAYALVL